ncbi:MAG: helix-turn-helix transcriptional regulator [Bacteroidota bacterium]
MKGSYLGEFQELVLLAILSLGEDAYGVSIQQAIKKVAGRTITRGALHSALSRLEDKNFLTSRFGESTQERGGRRKRIYNVTAAGQQALKDAQYVRDQFMNTIKPSFQYGS